MSIERGESTIPSIAVEYILGVSKTVLVEIVHHRLVNTIPQLGGKGGYEWEKEGIFRAFVAIDLIHKFEEKYGSNHPRLKYDQVRRDLLSSLRSKKDEYLDSEAWKEVIERGREKGVNLLGMNSNNTSK